MSSASTETSAIFFLKPTFADRSEILNGGVVADIHTSVHLIWARASGACSISSELVMDYFLTVMPRTAKPCLSNLASDSEFGAPGL
jgi:hypothetical protein